MSCGKRITLTDLGAKTCATVTEKEMNPFFTPIVVSEPFHADKYLCGQCAKGKDACPCCHGALEPREEVANAVLLHSLGKKEFAKRGILGTFNAVLVFEDHFSFFYILNGSSSTSFWMEI